MTCVAEYEPQWIKVRDTAQRAGYTRRVAVELGVNDLFGYIKPDAETDDMFTLIDDEDGTVYNVKGWLASSVEDIG